MARMYGESNEKISFLIQPTKSGSKGKKLIEKNVIFTVNLILDTICASSASESLTFV